jgi:hypothetical protein
MVSKDQLYSNSVDFFPDQWTVIEKNVVPEPKDLKFGNDAGH